MGIDFTPLLALALIGLATIIVGCLSAVGAAIGLLAAGIFHTATCVGVGAAIGAVIGLVLALTLCIRLWSDR